MAEQLLSVDDLSDASVWIPFGGATVSQVGTFWRVLDDSFQTEYIQQTAPSPGNYTANVQLEFAKTNAGSHNPFFDVSTSTARLRAIWQYSLGSVLYAFETGSISNKAVTELDDAFRVSFDMAIKAGESVLFRIDPSGGAGFLSGFWFDVRNPSVNVDLPEPIDPTGLAMETIRSRVQAAAVDAARSPLVASEANIASDEWAVDPSEGGHVFNALSGYLRGRNRGRLPFVEVDAGEPELPYQFVDGGVARTSVAVRIHVGGRDANTARNRANAILMAFLKELRSRRMFKTLDTNLPLPAWTTTPLGHMLEAVVPVEHSYSTTDYEVSL